jgi:phosphoribosyl 1,2-cyclic phosphodiesterase
VEEVQFTVLGSGSNGNASYLETPRARVLIDCGFSAKRIRSALLELDRTPERLDGILITHEHSDHIAGLKVLAAKIGIPVYCNRHTAEEIRLHHECTFDFQLFETGNSFEIGDLSVDTFSVPHDAIDPVGYMLHTPAVQIGFLTDLGHGTKLIADRVRQAKVLLLETNHDVDMLNNDPHRPWNLKQRIFSRHGHLSNESAADFLEQIVHADLQHIFCAHLSRDCNTPELAQQEITQKLSQLDATHIQVHVTQQNVACPTLRIAAKNRGDSDEKSVATTSAAL